MDPIMEIVAKSADISFLIAFGAGFISVFSPCVLPMLPIYTMYITGTTMESEVENNRVFAIKRTLLFILGFTIIFIAMGIIASLIGKLVTGILVSKLVMDVKDILAKIGGILIIVFGLSMLGVFKLKIFNFTNKIKGPKKMVSGFSSTLMGMAFAAGMSACSGPILVSILAMAGVEGTIIKGVLYLFVYSIGMAIPFLLTALFIGPFANLMSKGEKIIKYIPVVSGAFMIIFGLLIFFDKVKYINNFLLGGF